MRKPHNSHHHFDKCDAWGPTEEEAVGERRRSRGWKHPRPPTIRTPFNKEKATPAVLIILRETQCDSLALGERKT